MLRQMKNVGQILKFAIKKNLGSYLFCHIYTKIQKFYNVHVFRTPCQIWVINFLNILIFFLQVLQEDENNVKALFRKGQALNGLNKWDEALVSYLLKLFNIYWSIIYRSLGQ